LVTVKDGTSAVDISGASVKTIKFKKADNTDTEVAATFETDGTDGQMYYVSPDVDFFDAVGIWYYQAKVVIAGSTWRSNIEKFEVFENL